jgi:integrase
MADALAEYLERYTSYGGQSSTFYRLRDLFAHTGAAHPRDITTRRLLAYITDAKANNTVRARLSTARSFLRWCVQTGLIDSNPADLLPNITKSFPTTYGKVQDRRPARFLTYEQAFVQLVGACQDGTDVGLRDELVIRLGLSGMRNLEIATLPVAALATLPTIHWTGKGHRPRTLTAGNVLADQLRTWMALRKTNAGTPRPDQTVLLPARARHVSTAPRIDWTADRVLARSSIGDIVLTRAQMAGLGHVAPHDLRRSAAAILHHSTTADGAHRFDLLDIQRVLGHADPATTMRSYLEPMDSGTLDRASAVLD